MIENEKNANTVTITGAVTKDLTKKPGLKLIHHPSRIMRETLIILRGWQELNNQMFPEKDQFGFFFGKEEGKEVNILPCEMRPPSSVTTPLSRGK